MFGFHGRAAASVAALPRPDAETARISSEPTQIESTPTTEGPVTRVQGNGNSWVSWCRGARQQEDRQACCDGRPAIAELRDELRSLAVRSVAAATTIARFSGCSWSTQRVVVVLLAKLSRAA